jgi:hypothetical protein
VNVRFHEFAPGTEDSVGCNCQALGCPNAQTRSRSNMRANSTGSVRQALMDLLQGSRFYARRARVDGGQNVVRTCRRHSWSSLTSAFRRYPQADAVTCRLIHSRNMKTMARNRLLRVVEYQPVCETDSQPQIPGRVPQRFRGDSQLLLEPGPVVASVTNTGLLPGIREARIVSASAPLDYNSPWHDPLWALELHTLILYEKPSLRVRRR